MRTIIVGNSPEKSFANCYKEELNDFFIGVDGGSLTVISNNYALDLAIGDFDSTDNFTLIKTKAKILLTYPVKKNETDLELAILQAPTKNIYIYDTLGGRLDHELLTLMLLQKYNNLSITVFNKNNQITYLNEGFYKVDLSKYKYFSLIVPNKAVITTTGSLYNLTNVTLTSNDTYATSNEAIDKIINLTIHEGNLFLVLAY